jgi:hypothetical protein
MNPALDYKGRSSACLCCFTIRTTRQCGLQYQQLINTIVILPRAPSFKWFDYER